MKKLFPDMCDQPDRGLPFATLAYWAFAFVGIPFLIPILGVGLWGNKEAVCWLDFAYHVINALAVVVIYRNYFQESFLNVEIDPGKFFKTVGVALLLMLIVAVVLRFGLFINIFNAYPINEMSVAVTSGFMVEEMPVLGAICHTLITPIAVVGLFYTVGFAPLCCRKAWLGYLVVTGLLVIPTVFDIFWRGEPELVLSMFILRLPMHWIACWTYQKADTVWAPLATLSVFNLVTSVICVFFP